MTRIRVCGTVDSTLAREIDLDTEIVLTQNLCNLVQITQNNLLLGSTLWETAMKVKEKAEKI
jgi:hypothetical protein